MTTKPPAKKKERFVPVPVNPKTGKPYPKTPPPPKERFVPAPKKAQPPPKGKTPPKGTAPHGGSSAPATPAPATKPGSSTNTPSHEASRYHSQIPGAPTHDTSYTPSDDHAKQVVQQLKDLQSSMSQEDFAHLMQTNGLGSAPAGANGVLGEQQSTGAGQMGFKIPFTVDPEKGSPVPIIAQRSDYPPFATPVPAPGDVTQRVGSRGNPVGTTPITTGGTYSGGSKTPATPGSTSSVGGTLANTSGGVFGVSDQKAPTPQTPSSDQQNALATLEGLLSGAGLGGLVGQVQDLLSQGYTDPTSIEYLLEQTPEYQRRFSGNAKREANGLAPLSPSEYLATERSYQDVLRASGMPSGFYDSPDDFASWIASDVSPSEVQNRVNDALHFAQTTDPSTRSALAAYYGIDDAHIAAYFLDNQRALPLLNKQAATADIGGAALDQGLSLTDMNRALRFADLGVTQGQAQQAYGQIAGLLTPEQAIAKRFGTDYTQQTAEDELLGGDANAALKRSRLNMQEESLFAGASGTASGSLSTSASGSY